MLRQKLLANLDQDDVMWFIKRFAIRFMSMTTAWAALGFVMGVYIGIVMSQDLIMLVSQIIASMIVLVFIGSVLSCIYNRAIESVIGGLIGFLMGLVVFPAAQFELGQNAAVTLIIGGLMGTTCWPLVAILKQIVLALFELTLGSWLGDEGA